MNKLSPALTRSKRRWTSTLLALSVLAIAGCEDDVEPADEPNCQAPMIELYTAPGCGKDVRPSCLGGAGSCASFVCSCDGRVVSSCNGYSKEQYQFVYGAAPDAGACKAATQ